MSHPIPQKKISTDKELCILQVLDDWILVTWHSTYRVRDYCHHSISSKRVFINPVVFIQDRANHGWLSRLGKSTQAAGHMLTHAMGIVSNIKKSTEIPAICIVCCPCDTGGSGKESPSFAWPSGEVASTCSNISYHDNWVTAKTQQKF